MTFIWPPMLLLLVFIPIFVLLYLRMQMQRRKLVATYGRFTTTQTNRRSPGARRHVPPVLFLAALIILVVSLARPQAVVALPRVEGTVILAFDISASMAAEDLLPTRIDAAKAAAEEFVLSQPRTVQIGVVAFSDSGLAVLQPSYEQDEILAAIRRLAPARGTSLGNGMYAALTTILVDADQTNYYSDRTPEPTAEPTPMPPGVFTSGVIVLLSDGDNTEDPDPVEAAQMAAERGIRIFTIGIGSPAGTVLNIEGFNVFTQLNEPMLQQISQLTGGSYYNADSEEDLLDIYTDLTAQFVIKPEEMEITPLFAGVSLLLMLIGGTLSLLWFGRVV